MENMTQNNLPQSQTVSEMFNEIIDIYKNKFKQLITIMLIPFLVILPFGLIGFALFYTQISNPNFEDNFSTFISNSPAVGILFLGLLLLMIPVMIVISLWQIVASEKLAFEKESFSIKELTAQSKKYLMPVFISNLVLGLLVLGIIFLISLPLALFVALKNWILFGLYLFIMIIALFAVIIYLSLRFFVLSETIIFENLSWNEAFKRSTELTKGKFGNIFVKTVVFQLAIMAISIPFSIVSTIISAIGLDEISLVLNFIPQIMITPLGYIFSVVMYKDLVRTYKK